MESVLRGHPESCMPFCVREWQILDFANKHNDGLPGVVYHETDNHSAHREIVLPKSVRTDTIGIRLLNINGGEPVRGGVFEVRAYKE
jgi:hypothetical protein